MAERSLVEQKLEASRQLVRRLNAERAPLLAAYWELVTERDRWILYLVPKSIETEGELVSATSTIMIEPPFRSIFSLSDVFVDAQQMTRARAIGSYLHSNEEKQFDTTFTGREFFESVIVLYLAPELRKANHAA